MSPLLMTASLAITGALILYTIGVFKERADGRLRGIPSFSSGSALPAIPPAPRL